MDTLKQNESFKSISRLSHIALIVKDIDSMSNFYIEFTGMNIIHSRIDDDVKVVWLKHGNHIESLTIVMIESINSDQITNRTYQRVNHFGFDVISRSDVDLISEKAKQKGCLKYPAQDGGNILGYFCMIEDPNGNNLEFAYGQMRIN